MMERTNARSDLDTFFEQTIRPVLSKLDKKRHAIMIKGMAAAAGVGVLCIGGAILFSVTMDEGTFGQQIIAGTTIGIFLVVVLGGMTLYWMVYLRHRTFFRRYKEEVVKPLVSWFDSPLDYSPDGGIDADHINNTGFWEPPQQIASGDHFSGTIDERVVEINEMKLVWGNRRNTLRSRGIFIRFQTDVAPDKTVRLYPIPGKSVRETRDGEKVDLESDAFEEAFDVRGDPVIAREILTPRAMSELLAVREQMTQIPYVSYKGGAIYLYIQYSRDLFEPSIFTGLRKEDIEQTLADLELLVSVIQTLNVRQGYADSQ